MCTHTHIHTHTYIYIYVCMYVHTHTYIHSHTHTPMHILLKDICMHVETESNLSGQDLDNMAQLLRQAIEGKVVPGVSQEEIDPEL
jgi:hypothetical protein